MICLTESTVETYTKTRSAYLWTQVLNTPIWVLFNILQYIIYKDLHATHLQTTIVVTLKPLVSLVSIYWGAAVENRSDRLLSNIIWARLFSTLPFLFFPFVENIWFFIASFAIYMVLARGTMPAWMEILRLNIPKASHAKIFSSGAFITHCGNCLLPFVMGAILDSYVESWRWLFPATALLSLTSIFFQLRIPIEGGLRSPSSTLQTPTINHSFQQFICGPWSNAFQLMRRRGDFKNFQLGFMLGGGAMMLTHPVLPQFFVENLHLSYTEMSLAVNGCKALGFLMTSPLWASYLNKTGIFRFSAFPPLCICVFSSLLLLSNYHIGWLFLAYFFYGVTQAGGDLSWHLSGTIFAKNEESTPFSNLNLLAVGLRGCIIPPLGSLICLISSAPIVIAFGGLLSLLSNRVLINFDKQQILQAEKETETLTCECVSTVGN